MIVADVEKKLRIYQLLLFRAVLPVAIGRTIQAYAPGDPYENHHDGKYLRSA